VHRALAKTPADRFATMSDLLQALRTPDVARTETAPSPAGRRTVVTRRLVVPVAVGVAAVAAIMTLMSGSERPTLDALRSAVAARDPERAYQLAVQMNATEISDSLWSAFTVPVTIHSSPAGATVQRRAYETAEVNRWDTLGTTPLTIARFPQSASVLRLEAEGHRTVDVAFGRNGTTDTIILSPVASLPERWRHVPGALPGYAGGPEFAFRYVAPNLSLAPPIRLPDFQLGQYEVTNAEYKQFVDAGGYRDRKYWEHPFERDGRAVRWEDAITAFTDSTGRPGPSTWSFGTYREGRGDHPVTGVSWYESAAYARFVGKELPTVYHWFRAATTWLSDWIIPASNMAAAGPMVVGTNAGMSQFGIYDMAGNAREWAFNASGDERYILGGGWADDPYVFTVANSAPPFDRSPMNGFRLASYGTDAGAQSATRAPIDHPVRDFARETPVSDAVFQVYKRLYAYDRAPLDVESQLIDSTETWIREYVTFRAAYGNERVGLHLYTPRGKRGPFQTVVYFPGSNALWQSSFDQYSTDHAEMIVRSGRAFAFPVYKSTFDRRDGFVYRRQDLTNTYRDHVLHWAKDLGRSLDYLESRADIDAGKFAYLGYSWGGMIAPIMLSTEPRLKLAVLGLPGLSPLPTQPEVDAFNFVGRASQPVLMLSGEYDMIHPLETTARPLFALWNAPADRKKHVVARGGHQVPYYVMVQETLAWLDRFLGPI
jgi:predicted esterase